jgi:biotin carboxylase
MRRKLKKFCPANNPKFTIVKSGDKADVDRIINKIGFPMIVKPANLEASVLVSICYHRAELEKVLKRIQKKMVGEYNKLRRSQAPRIIAEEFMDGDMYSVDSYVDSRGRITHCPLVKIKTGKYKGHDDFYNYLRVTPVKLKSETINNAQTVASNAIRALGLRSSTAHVELMKLDSDWKVIEVGARLGGFRHELYNLSCGIDHYLNDVLIRIAKEMYLFRCCITILSR